MNAYLLKNLKGITSASIEKYLLFTGWIRDDTFRNPRMWVFKNKLDPERSALWTMLISFSLMKYPKDIRIAH